MSSDAIYRDTMEPARRALAQELADRRRELGQAAPLVVIHGRRVARVTAGAIVAAVMLGCFVTAFASIGKGGRGGLFGSPRVGPLTALLLGSWIAGVLGYVEAGWIAGRRFAARLAALAARLTEEEARGVTDPASALERLAGEGRPFASLRARVENLEAASIGWPLAAASLAVPLTLHCLVWALAIRPTETFDSWIISSVVVVGHAHLFLAGYAARFVRRLPRDSFSELMPLHAGWWALLWAGLGTFVPWVIVAGVAGCALFGLIPTVLVLITGVVFLPATYDRAGHIVVKERARLAALGR